MKQFVALSVTLEQLCSKLLGVAALLAMRSSSTSMAISSKCFHEESLRVYTITAARITTIQPTLQTNWIFYLPSIAVKKTVIRKATIRKSQSIKSCKPGKQKRFKICALSTTHDAFPQISYSSSEASATLK